jgi:hypothetical protein
MKDFYTIKDTTGFSRVVVQLQPNKSQSRFLRPPTLVAWWFNFGLADRY